MPLTAGVIAIAVLFGERLLPERHPRSIAPDFSGHARTLIAQYELDHAADELMTRRSGVAEVVIPPRSALAGDRVFPGMITESGDLAILAVQRQGDDTGPGETVLAEGDTLLLQGTWAALDAEPRRPRGARRRPARAGAPAGRAAGRGGAGGAGRAGGHGARAGHRRRAARRSPAWSPPAR